LLHLSHLVLEVFIPVGRHFHFLPCLGDLPHEHIVLSLDLLAVSGLSSDLLLELLSLVPVSLVLHLLGVELDVEVVDPLLLEQDFILNVIFLILDKSDLTEHLVNHCVFGLQHVTQVIYLLIGFPNPLGVDPLDVLLEGTGFVLEQLVLVGDVAELVHEGCFGVLQAFEMLLQELLLFLHLKVELEMLLKHSVLHHLSVVLVHHLVVVRSEQVHPAVVALCSSAAWVRHGHRVDDELVRVLALFGLDLMLIDDRLLGIVVEVLVVLLDKSSKLLSQLELFEVTH
jgi:hypothetical protein